jgi:hypothetical protein
MENSMIIRLFVILLLLSAGVAIAVYSDSEHSFIQHHRGHSAMANTDNTVPKTMPIEAGQGAFAAIAEIVALLAQAPSTDWSSVNIDGLRKHLVDMNHLTLNAKVSQKISDEKVVFTVTGTGQTLTAIQTMVPAHSAELEKITDWQTQTKLTDSGITLTISSSAANEIKKIAGLGFFGVMATGAHHQSHHLLMATGKGHHH